MKRISVTIADTDEAKRVAEQAEASGQSISNWFRTGRKLPELRPGAPEGNKFNPTGRGLIPGARYRDKDKS